MQTAESNNAALTERIDLDADPATSSDANKKKSSNKPEQETDRENKKTQEKQKRRIRAYLTRDLWTRYRTEDLKTADRIKIAALLAKLTEKRKAPSKALFTA